MTAKNKWTWLVAILLISMSAEKLQAQDYFSDGFGDSDLQFFSPVDFDFEDRPIRKSGGFFFNYDKLSWAFTGERTTVGSGGTSSGSMNPWRVFDDGGFLVPNPGGDPEFIFTPGATITIAAPLLPSGISSGPPRAEFGWGERYEFGRWEKDNGWLIGILDGPEAVSAVTYGFGITGQDDTVTTAPLGITSPFPGAPPQLISPLGSVLVVFEDPGVAFAGGMIPLMSGFLDVVDGTIGAVPGGALEGDTNGDGVLDGDGMADDIDRDGQFGPDGLDTEDPGEIPDRLGGGLNADFGDLVVLPTSFQTLGVRNSTEMQGIEIMRTHRLDNRHHMTKKQGNELELSYGVRYLRLKDNFLVNGTGGVLGTSFWDTTITNNLVGPQIAMKWRRQRRRLLLDFGGRFLFGYNIQNFDQSAALGEDLITGQHNHPLFLQPTVSTHGKQENDFSPLVEIRAQASYQVTSAIALKLGYTATFIDNIRRASQQVRYRLPGNGNSFMGFRDGGTQEIFINGVNFGFDVVY